MLDQEDCRYNRGNSVFFKGMPTDQYLSIPPAFSSPSHHGLTCTLPLFSCVAVYLHARVSLPPGFPRVARFAPPLFSSQEFTLPFPWPRRSLCSSAMALGVPITRESSLPLFLLAPGPRSSPPPGFRVLGRRLYP